MLTLGPYAQLGLIVAGLWLFVISAALACIVAGAIGNWISRRSGRKCPACDYQGNRVDVVVHHALDHERGALTMRVHIIHHHYRPWPPPKNHMDRRVCPTCKATVHGDKAQREHEDYHLTEREFRLRLNGWLEEFAKRTGMTEEEFGGDWKWGAEITGTEGEIEAADSDAG